MLWVICARWDTKIVVTIPALTSLDVLKGLSNLYNSKAFLFQCVDIAGDIDLQWLEAFDWIMYSKMLRQISGRRYLGN